MLEFFIGVVAAFLLGYCLGHRNGKSRGLTEGESLTPILLRQQSYEQGYCILCRKRVEKIGEDDHTSAGIY